jgi:hypothetical protein
MSEAVKALAVEEILALSERHIDDWMDDDGPDLEVEDIGLARPFGEELVELVRVGWAQAREARVDRERIAAEKLAEQRVEAEREAARFVAEDVAKGLFIYPIPHVEVVGEVEGAQVEAKPEEPKLVRRENLKRKPAEPEPELATLVEGIAKKAGVVAEPVAKPKIAAPMTWPEPPEAPAGASAAERLTYPRGLLGHATQYVEDTAPFPNRWLSLFTSTSALAKGLDRKVLGPTGNSTVQWLLLLAETGAGKQHSLNCIRIMLRAMGLEDTFVASGLGSVQGIEEILMGRGEVVEAQPNALVVIDEVGAWLKRISSGGQTGNVAEIPALLQSLWGWPPQLEWTGSKTKGKDMDVVHGPAFSLFGVSTETKFVRALTGEQVSNGFVNRMLLANVGRGAEKRVKTKYDWTNFPGWLADALKAVAGGPRPEGPMLLKGLNGAVLRDFRRIEWGAGAEDKWQHYEDEVRGMVSTEDRELWIRAPENALRLATIVAAYRGSSLIEVEDLEWGIGVANQSMHWLVGALRRNMMEDLDQADLVDLIRAEFLKKLKKGEPGQLTKGQIRKLCERKTKDYRKIEQAILHLVECGDMVLLKQEGPGRPTRKWEWQV